MGQTGVSVSQVSYLQPASGVQGCRVQRGRLCTAQLQGHHVRRTRRGRCHMGVHSAVCRMLAEKVAWIQTTFQLSMWSRYIDLHCLYMFGEEAPQII